MPKRASKTRPKRTWLLYAGGLIVITALVVQSLLIWQLYSRTDEQGTTQLKDVLISSITSLGKSPAVETTTGRQFLPSVHLVLPADTGRLYYRDGDGNTVWFIDASNQLQAFSKIRTAKTLPEVFSQVATAQSCSRQLVVGINDQNPDPGGDHDKLTFVSAKTLKDGRIVYIYQNNKCPYGPEALVKALKQVESF